MSEDKTVEVVEWVDWKTADQKKLAIQCMGGWFEDGHRWDNYLQVCEPHHIPYVEALRRKILKEKLKCGGDWHQRERSPLFSDGTAAQFSYRAWGDLMAAVWSSAEEQDFNYMDFYSGSPAELKEKYPDLEKNGVGIIPPERNFNFDITFGSISLRFDGDQYWLTQSCGEAMTIGEKELEKILQEYYKENF